MPASPRSIIMLDPLYCQPASRTSAAVLDGMYVVVFHWLHGRMLFVLDSNPLLRPQSMFAQSTPPVLSVTSSLNFQTYGRYTKLATGLDAFVLKRTKIFFQCSRLTYVLRRIGTSNPPGSLGSTPNSERTSFTYWLRGLPLKFWAAGMSADAIT